MEGQEAKDADQPGGGQEKSSVDKNLAFLRFSPTERMFIHRTRKEGDKNNVSGLRSNSKILKRKRHKDKLKLFMDKDLWNPAIQMPCLGKSGKYFRKKEKTGVPPGRSRIPHRENIVNFHQNTSRILPLVRPKPLECTFDMLCQSVSSHLPSVKVTEYAESRNDLTFTSEEASDLDVAKRIIVGDLIDLGTPKSSGSTVHQLNGKYQVPEVNEVTCKYLHEQKVIENLQLPLLEVDEADDKNQDNICKASDNTLQLSFLGPLLTIQPCSFDGVIVESQSGEVVSELTLGNGEPSTLDPCVEQNPHFDVDERVGHSELTQHQCSSDGQHEAVSPGSPVVFSGFPSANSLAVEKLSSEFMRQRSPRTLIDLLNKDPYPKIVRERAEVPRRRRAFSCDDTLMAVLFGISKEGAVEQENSIEDLNVRHLCGENHSPISHSDLSHPVSNEETEHFLETVSVTPSNSQENSDQTAPILSALSNADCYANASDMSEKIHCLSESLTNVSSENCSISERSNISAEGFNANKSRDDSMDDRPQTVPKFPSTCELNETAPVGCPRNVGLDSVADVSGCENTPHREGKLKLSTLNFTSEVQETVFMNPPLAGSEPSHGRVSVTEQQVLSASVTGSLTECDSRNADQETAPDERHIEHSKVTTDQIPTNCSGLTAEASNGEDSLAMGTAVQFTVKLESDDGVDAEEERILESSNPPITCNGNPIISSGLNSNRSSEDVETANLNRDLENSRSPYFDGEKGNAVSEERKETVVEVNTAPIEEAVTRARRESTAVIVTPAIDVFTPPPTVRELSQNDSSFSDSCMTPLERWILPGGKKFRRSLSIIRHLDDTSTHVRRGKQYENSVMEIIRLQGDKEVLTPVQSLRARLSHRRSSWMRQMTPPPVRRSTFVWSPTVDHRRTLYETPHPRKSIYSTPMQQNLMRRMSVRASPSLGPRRSMQSPFKDSPESPVQYTIRDLILTICKQAEPCSFSDILDRKSFEGGYKIGEGVFGEVFSVKREGGDTVLKIIPIEGQQFVNGEKQKTYQEVLSELVIAKVLDELQDEASDESNQTSGYAEVIATSLVQDCYPDALLKFWEEFDSEKGSDNENPKIFAKDQLFIVMEQGNGGKDLESYTFSSAKQALSIFKQIAFSLAVAEMSVEFEHRDLHWGNVLVSKTSEKQIHYMLNGTRYSFNSNGVKATIIDYTLSRIKYINQVPIYSDIGRDPEMFIATGDYQFDIYRYMKTDVEDDWSRFAPKTNARWLHYLLDKMLTRVKYQRKTARVHKDSFKALEEIAEWVEGCGSALAVALRLAESKY